MKGLTSDDCIRIGVFRKPYGVGGTLLLAFDPEWETSLEGARVILVESEGLPVPWFVSGDGITILSSGTALVDLDWVEDEAAARKLVGSTVLLLKKEVAPPEAGTTPDRGYLGYRILDPEKGFSGVVIAEADYSGNLVLTVESGNREILLPYHSDFLLHADFVAHTLTVSLPEGLLEL